MDVVNPQAPPSAIHSSYRVSHEENSSYLQRLFIGWVPKHYTEKDLVQLFSDHGIVRDCIVIKDKVTQQPRGAAFVSYATKEEAAAAITALNRQVHLPGALHPLEVRFAKNHHFVAAGTGPADNRQLFFSGAPRSASEQEITQIFSAYGNVEEVTLFRERKTGSSKGSGLVMMATRQEAVRVMEMLGSRGEQQQQPADGLGTGLQVLWADPALQQKKRVALEQNNAENRMLFFARALRSVSEEEVKALFAQFGQVFDVVLFRAFQGAPTSRGCGLVTLETHAAAAAALDALNTKYTWPGMQSPMVVKWMDATLQSRRREHHIMAAAQSNPILPMGMTASGVAGLASLPLIQAQVGSYAAPQLLPPQLQGMHSAGLIQAGGQSLRHAPDGVLVHNAQLSQVSYLSAPHSSAWGLQAARTASGSEVRLPQAGLQHGQGGRGMASRQYLQGRNQHGATEWLQLGASSGMMGMAGPSGYEALSAPMFPLHRQPEDQVTTAIAQGAQLQQGSYQVLVTGNGGPFNSQVLWSGATPSSQLFYISPEYLSM